MNNQELDQLVEKAATTAVIKAEKHFEQHIDDKLKEYQEQTERYLGALKEDFDYKLDTVLEHVKTIEDKQDMMFDKIGVMAEDIEIIKDTVQNHERRITALEH